MINMEPENKMNTAGREGDLGYKQDYKSLQDQLNAQQQALAQIYKSVEKTRKHIFWNGVINLVVFVLPLIFVAIALPKIMNSFNSALGGFSGSDTGAALEVLADPSLHESLENLKGLGLGF